MRIFRKLIAGLLIAVMFVLTIGIFYIPRAVKADSTNIALNKTATAFATSGGGYSPDKTVDGTTSYVPAGAWAWDSSLGTDTDGSTWWQVDLGGKASIYDVKIYYWGYDNIYSHVPETITFQVSDDEENWITVIDETFNVPTENTTYSSTPHTYELDSVGRYVRLKFEDLGQNGGPIILSEIEVYGEILSTNIALDKSTSAFATSAGYSPNNAVDGVTSYVPAGAWAWDESLGTDTDGSTWWQVDLINRATIDDVKIYFWGYNNIYSHVPETITFQVSDDGESWTTVIDESSNVPTENATYSSTPYSYTINSFGRYLRMKFEDLGQNGGPIFITEAEVYGEINIAYDKPTSAFATSSGGYSSDKAVDGTTSYIPAGAWAWDSSLGTDTDGSTWWQIDLMGKASIHDVRIYYWGYNNIYSHVPETITFETSDDGISWTTVIDESSKVPIEDTSYSSTPYSYILGGEGRYLRLKFEDLGQNGGPIIISEIEVYGEILTSNVSLNNLATAFATSAGGYSPGKAVDGTTTYVPAGAWAWDSSLGTDTDGSTWWQIDLRGRTVVDDVRIYFWGYDDIYSHVPETITFQTSIDGINWTTIIDESSNVPTENTTYSDIPYTYTLNSWANFVRLKFEDLGQDGGPIIISEIEVYGKNEDDASFSSFSFAGLNPQVDGKFNKSKRIIYLTVPYGTNLTSLAASFESSPGSEVKVGSTVQQSGVTQNNFTNPVTYTVTGESGLVTTYTVKVITAAQNPLTRQERVDQWYTDAKIGSFECWGLFTGGPSSSYYMEYESAAEFEAAAISSNWSAEDMLEPIVNSGAQYLVLCSFHSGPAGYVKPWPSEVPGTQCTTTDFYGDLLDEADEQGIKVLIYITCDPSLWAWDPDLNAQGDGTWDWIYPEYRSEEGWADYAFDVVDELMDNYGDQIAGFWFDGAGSPGRTMIWNTKGTFEYIHDRYPHYIIVGNSGDDLIFNDYDVVYGEFKNATPSPSYNLPSAYTNRPLATDLCVEIPVHVTGYIYFDGDNYTSITLDNAIKTIVCIAGNKERWNSNLVVAPKIDGTLPSNPDTLMSGLGDFLDWAGESIYDTVPGQFNNGYEGGYYNDSSYVVTTQSSTAHYIHVLTPPSSDTYVTVANNGIVASSVINLETQQSVSFTQNGTSITINCSSWDSADTIFKIIV